VTDKQPTLQAERTAHRAAFRDRWSRPQQDRADADHDRAIEAFIHQLAPLRCATRGKP
jgi:hypothetical protein